LLVAGAAMKINVIGTSGSGKSTVARSVARKLDIPYIELDALFWRPDWQETPDDEFFAAIEGALAGKDSWVVDGNYSRTQALKWRDVDMIVWVDYSFSRTMYQAVRRAATRAWAQTELWPGTSNRESFRRSFFSRKSTILWTLQNYSKTRRKYETFFTDPKWQHIRMIRLRTPAETRTILQSMTKH
jgi:adenylate kinase family enzyme